MGGRSIGMIPEIRLAIRPLAVRSILGAVFCALLMIGTHTWGENPVLATPDLNTSFDFRRDVRPLLSDHCFACHGPDEHDRQAGIRLDTAEGISDVVDLESWEDSLIVERIRSDDPDVVMPPADFHKPLDDKAKSLIERWVKSGAPFQDHWAFVPPRRTELTNFDQPIADADEPDRPRFDRIDQWIDQALANNGLQPNGSADRFTLARRVSFDLIGLPPTWDDVASFAADHSPNAYESFVDSLLQNPAYGEHVGRYWLDLVRYADTHGMHFDNYREMWPYRDWVINSFNDNKPFDVFITEQLAGDLLPNASRDQLIASGFNRLNLTTNEGGTIYEEVFAHNVMDRTDAFGTIFLGLTTGCAVCHDHKFDPITQKDYYSLSAFFNSLDGKALDGNNKSHPPFISLPSDEQTAELTEVREELAMLAQEMQGPITEVDAAQNQWQRSFASYDEQNIIEAQSIQARNIEGSSEAIWLGDVHVAGPFPIDDTKARYKQKYADEDQNRFDADAKIKRPDLEYSWQQRDDVLPVLINALDGLVDQPSVSVLHQTLISPKKQEMNLLIDTDERHVIFFNGKEVGAKRDATIFSPLSRSYKLKMVKGINHLFIRTIQGKEKQSNGHNRLAYAYQDKSAEMPKRLMHKLNTLASIPTKDQSAELIESLRSFYRATYCDHPKWLAMQDMNKGMKKIEKNLNDRIPVTLVWKELNEPRDAFVLERGEYDAPREKVNRATPTFLPPMAQSVAKNRLELAKWLTDPDHPLTARVAVNRFWQQLFGTGLVKTSEDFGNQGSPPSHPELLDELSIDFRVSGWDVKALLKRLVMTNVYRRDSRTSPKMLEVDPNNRLLARGPRFRLDAEMLRDQMLSVSGLLVHQIGGPSVKPPQPAGLWAAVGYTGSDTGIFVADEGDSVHRRSVYTFWKRTSVSPAMSTFDAPSRESCTARRERTNTPLQALLLMNEPQVLEASHQLAKLILSSDGNDEAKLQRLFQRTTLRAPRPNELKTLTSLTVDLTNYYSNQLDQAHALIGTSDAPLAAWTIVANTLLNLDEVVCK